MSKQKGILRIKYPIFGTLSGTKDDEPPAWLRDYEQIAVVMWVPVEDIKAASYNPTSRTEKQALRKLCREIETIGGIVSPLTVGSDGVLADGHRRLACAILLGMTHVPVIFRTETSEMLYASMNAATLPHNSKQSAEAVAQGFPLELVRGGAQSLITKWIELLGPEDFTDMVQRRSPYIVQQALTLSKYCGLEDDIDFQRRTLIWMDAHDMVRASIEVRSKDVLLAPHVIVNKINSDEPLRQGWE